jgi:predicted DNA-binding transcriptional regulator AlpA
MRRETAARYCELSKSGFDGWVRCGRLPPPMKGTKRWSKRAIDTFLERHDGLPSGSGNDEEDALDEWMRENGFDG